MASLGKRRRSNKTVKKEEKASMSCVLPHDVLFDILTRLPAKTIGKFRCVSKQWCSSLSDPLFINKHLTVTQRDCHQTKLMINAKLDDVHGLYTIDCSSLPEYTPDHNELRLKELIRPVPSSETKRHWIVGCTNGIFCLLYPDIKIICLWNPCTNEFKRLNSSLANTRACSGEPLSYNAFGFGYSSQAKDYEVVRIAKDKHDPHKRSIAYIYSLAKDRYRRIRQIPYTVKNYGKLVNGALHWVVASRGEPYPCLLAYDIGGEAFREVPQPKYTDYRFKLAIRNDQDKLTICCIYPMKHTDFWRLEEYGVKESWEKRFSLKHDGPQIEYPINVEYPINYQSTTNHHWNIFFSRGHFCLYDPRTGCQFKLHLGDDKAALGKRSYRESLVKLNLQTYEPVRWEFTEDYEASEEQRIIDKNS